MQAVFDYLDGLALLDFIVVGAVLLMGVYLAAPDIADGCRRITTSWRRWRQRRRSEAFRSDHPDRTPLAAPRVSSPPPVGHGARRDLQQRGASDGVTSTPAGAADTSLLRSRPDLHPHMPTRNERGRRR